MYHLVLAAGDGTRFKQSLMSIDKTSNKLLYPFKTAHEGCLLRLLSQIHENYPLDVILVAI